MTNDERYMQRALRLASYGRGSASPNPTVGAVIVAKGKIIGEGWHRRCGGPHAEVHAIASVKERELLSQSTIYVTLEPCSHWGRTPPCADLIIRSGIPRVVVGCGDPFEKVAGRGIAMLRTEGIEVLVGCLEQQCRQLIAPFITYHTLHRPYIILKWAETSDGFVDRIRQSPDDGAALRISPPAQTRQIHRLRTMIDAILIGSRTLWLDNPSLTARQYYGRSPHRIAFTPRDKAIPAHYHMLDGTAHTTLLGIDTPRPENLEQLMAWLYDKEIQSLMVEGGTQLLQSFIDANLYDQLMIERGSYPIGSGVKAPTINSPVTNKSLHLR